MRAVVRLLAYVLLTVPAMPVQAVAVAFGLPLRKSLPQWYHRRCCRIMGFRVERRGRKSRVHPTLYVCNHVSYFDIMVLGSLMPVSFVAKAEVARWPFFGWLARLQETVFVARRGREAGSHLDEIRARLEAGDDLVLFPEGTSSDGNRVLPFKSTLFAVAEPPVRGQPLCVQPVSIAYTRLDGVPMGRYLRPFFAWFGDMDLVGHLWHAAGLGRATMVVEFHKPVTIAEFGSRKRLSAHCETAVAKGLASALAGRRPERLPSGETTSQGAVPAAPAAPVSAPVEETRMTQA